MGVAVRPYWEKACITSRAARPDLCDVEIRVFNVVLADGVVALFPGRFQWQYRYGLLRIYDHLLQTDFQNVQAFQKPSW